MAGIDEPLGIADVFAIKADADSDPGLIEAARAAGFTVVDVGPRRWKAIEFRRLTANSGLRGGLYGPTVTTGSFLPVVKHTASN